MMLLLFLQEQIQDHHHQKRGEKRERGGGGEEVGREEREITEAREGLPGVEPGRHGKPLPVPRMRVCC
jgi:hypothetical protein